MPKRISNKLKDPNQIAAAVVAISTADEPTDMDKATISRAMAAMGRKGGKIGGKRRLETMSKSERTRIATQAARARWKKPHRKP